MPMTDRDAELDRLLAEALAPPDRAPDQQFVERVRQHVRLDELERGSRARLLEKLGIELLSLVALGCGLAAIGGSSEIGAFAREAPHLALPAVMLVFALWVPLVAGSKVATFGKT